MKLVITGATGAAGIQIFRQAITDASISKITVLSRRALPSWMDLPANNKTEVVFLQDFLEYPAGLPALLAEHDACLWALGTSSVGLSEEQYTRITYDYAMTFVNQVREFRKNETGELFRFIFISGESADQSEKGRFMFSRIKGRTEKALLDLPPSAGIKTQIMRPAYFFPSKDHPSDRLNIRSSSARVRDAFLTPILKNMLPRSYTPIEELGRFVVEVAKGQWGQETIFTNTRMRELVRGLGQVGGSL